jgi:radical SAM superfamily enzyme YgiQ (UPF0313 family)
MNILLIWPAVKSTELNNFLPLGLGYLAANIPDNHNIKIWDGIVNNDSNKNIIKEIKEFKPAIVGISIWDFNFKYVQKIVDQIKNNLPELIVVLGGPTVSGLQDRILQRVSADYAFWGESESSFYQFINLYSKSRLNLENKKNIHGLIYRNKNNKVVHNEPQWQNLDNLKYCDYKLIHFNQYLNNGYYYGMHPNAKYTAPIMTTRGCPFPCEYCGARLINGKKVRTRSIKSVISEIKELYNEYQVRGFNIIDDNFTFNIEYAKQICREIIKLNLENVSFNSPNGIKVEYIDAELLALMKRTGWKCIFIAPESGSKQTLKRMNKKINLKVVKEKMYLIKSYGFKIFGFFMIGYPGETVDDIKKTIDFAWRNEFDSVVFTCFTPLSGTPIYEKLLSIGEINDSYQYSDYYNVTYASKGLTIGQLKFWRIRGLYKFHTSSFQRFWYAFSNYSFRRIILFIRKII